MHQHDRHIVRESLIGLIRFVDFTLPLLAFIISVDGAWGYPPAPTRLPFELPPSPGGFFSPTFNQQS